MPTRLDVLSIDPASGPEKMRMAERRLTSGGGASTIETVPVRAGDPASDEGDATT